MKATVHICKRSPKLSDLEHNYRAVALRSKAEREFAGSRVYAVDGDACGVGFIMQAPGHEKGMMAILSGPQATRPGRLLRQIILSAESMPGATQEEFEAALEKLMKAARKWVEKYAPGCRWAAFAHQDREHPHVHLVVENWDYRHGKRRLDLRPSLLEEMQEMTWCAGLGIVTGKGSMGKVRNGMKLAEAGIDIGSAKTWQQRVELCAWSAFSSRAEAAKELLMWCREKQPEKSVDALLEALLIEPLPPGWDLKHQTKAGGDLRKPSVKINGKTLRLGTFIDMFAPRLNHSGMTLESPGSPPDDPPI